MSPNISVLQSADEMDLDIRNPVTGEPIGWTITFAGPGHPTTIALSDELTRQIYREQSRIEQARINGRKWKPEEKDPESDKNKLIRVYAGRILRWSYIEDSSGEEIKFSCETAAQMLADRRMPVLFNQVSEFLGDMASFLPNSAESSPPSQSTSSASPE